MACSVACGNAADGPVTADECRLGQQGCSCLHEESCDTGLECQSGTCVTTDSPDDENPVDHCADDPCDHGSCNATASGFTCSCDAGFMGEACDQEVENDCDDAPCANGTCTSLTEGDYSCACDSGWSGPNCDQESYDCASSPCENGTCVEGVDSSTCICDPGWEGDRCHINVDDCASDPCDRGICVDDLDGYVCSCETGWTGELCDQPVSGCEDSPCSHGTCTDTGPATYACVCDSGWDGENCDACAADHTLEQGACIDQKQVECNAQSVPAHATATIADVTITYTTAGGWTEPAPCAFTCDDGWGGADCDIPTTTCDCSGPEVCDDEGACYEPGLIDDFRTCDPAIIEAEGRIGNWYFFRGPAVSCTSPCEDVSTPPWGSECGAWTRGGSTGGDGNFVGMGLSLNDDGPLYDACHYDSIEVTYGSDQAVNFFAKWGGVGASAPRSSVILPATSGVSTRTVTLSSFPDIDCSTLTEFQFEPTSITSGFGIAVYELRFASCTDGALRCGSGGGLEECVLGEWTSSSCPGGQLCAGNQCVGEDATPVELHGHLAVSGTHLVGEHGQPVQLKGISSHWLNWSNGYQLSLPALEWMRDNWNLSVFRAAMGTNVEGGYLWSQAARDEMLAQVETIIDNAVTAGVYVIVDWHSHYAEDEQAQAEAFFQDIAARYGYLPNVLYEVYNEPLNVDWDTVLRPYHEDLVAAIRAAETAENYDHENVILLGTPNWSQDVDVAIDSRVAGNNLMYVLHFYSCSHEDSFRSRAQSALSAGVPLFVTEWGATHADGGVGNTPVCTSSANAWHNWMDANHIGWAAWKLDDCRWEIAENLGPDTSCLLAEGAPVDGPWTSQWLSGHASYVVGRMQD